MRYIINTLLFFLFLVVVISLHMVASYIFPFPFNKVNIIFSILIISLFYFKTGKIVWLAFILHFFIDMYSTTPFGIVLLSGTLSMLAIYWIAQIVLANPNIALVAISGAAVILIYRVFYSFFIFIAKFWLDISFSFRQVLSLYLWELLFTSIVTSLIYLVISLFARKKPELSFQ